MKMVRSLLLVVALSFNVPLHSFIDGDWEIPTPVHGVLVLLKKDDIGFKYELPVVIGKVKGKVTAKSVAKSLDVLAKSESEFIINQCMGNQIPTAYSWSDIAGNTISFVFATLLADEELKKDLQKFYALKKQLHTVQALDLKQSILVECVILKHRIKARLKKKSQVKKQDNKKSRNI